MKKLFFAALLLLAGTAVIAQKGKVSSAITYKEGGKLDKAWEAIKETLDPANPKSEKTINWTGAWQARGEIIEAIILSKDENFKKLVENPVEEAYKSYMKAMELDEKGGSPGLKIKLMTFSNTLINVAVEAFQSNDFAKATDYFEKKLAIDGTPLFKSDPVDTAIIYNTGLAAMNAKLFKKAIKYFADCTTYGYNGGSSFAQMISAYQQLGDTVKSVEVMKEAFKKYPNDQSINVQLINYYIMSGQPNEAISYLDKAIEREKDNSSFYLAKGVALDRLGRQEDAIAVYKKATEIKPDNADAYYNIGVIYFNRGVKQFDVANSVPTTDQVRYEAEKVKSDEEFKKAVPFLEKAVQYNPKDSYILDQLKNLYYRLKMMDKFDALNKK
ncbi:MAG: tetratricopeptide repeat protein [Mariniphaga sp.]